MLNGTGLAENLVADGQVRLILTILFLPRRLILYAVSISQCKQVIFADLMSGV
jgi:hypothetical protein